jgi:hypothetical protein
MWGKSPRIAGGFAAVLMFSFALNGCAGGGLFSQPVGDPFISSFPPNSLIVLAQPFDGSPSYFIALSPSGSARRVNYPRLEADIVQIVHAGTNYYIAWKNPISSQVTISENTQPTISGSSAIVTDAKNTDGTNTTSIFSITPSLDLVYLDSSGNVATIPVSGGLKRLILNSESSAVNLVASPDGSSSLILTNVDSSSFVYILKGTLIQQAVPVANYGLTAACWAPDSSKIYIEGVSLDGSSTAGTIYSLTPGSSPVPLITLGNYGALARLTVSSDGTKLIGDNSYYVLEADLRRPSNGFQSFYDAHFVSESIQFWSPKNVVDKTFFFGLFFKS